MSEKLNGAEEWGKHIENQRQHQASEEKPSGAEEWDVYTEKQGPQKNTENTTFNNVPESRETPKQRFGSVEQKAAAMMAGHYEPKSERERSALEHKFTRGEYDQATKAYYEQSSTKKVWQWFTGKLPGEKTNALTRMEDAQNKFESAQDKRQEVLKERLTNMFGKDGEVNVNTGFGEDGKPIFEKRKMNPEAQKAAALKMTLDRYSKIEDLDKATISEAIRPKSGIGKWWNQMSPATKKWLGAGIGSGVAYATGGVANVATRIGRMALGGLLGYGVSRFGVKQVEKFKQEQENMLNKQGLSGADLAGADLLQSLRESRKAVSSKEKKWAYASMGAAAIAGAGAGQVSLDSGNAAFMGANMFAVPEFLTNIFDSGEATPTNPEVVSTEWMETVREDPVTIDEVDSSAHGETIGDYNDKLSDPDFVASMKYDDYENPSWSSSDPKAGTFTGLLQNNILGHEAYGFMDPSERENVAENLINEFKKSEYAPFFNEIGIDIECLDHMDAGLKITGEQMAKLNQLAMSVDIEYSTADGPVTMNLVDRSSYLTQTQREWINDGNWEVRTNCIVCEPEPVAAPVVPSAPVAAVPEPQVVITDEPVVTSKHVHEISDSDDNDNGWEAPVVEDDEPAPDNPGVTPDRDAQDTSVEVAPDNLGGTPARDAQKTTVEVADTPKVTETPEDNLPGSGG